MPRTSFVVTVIDASPVPDAAWRSQTEARLRTMGATVVVPDDDDLVDIAIVRGENPTRTVDLAYAMSEHTERGSLFAIWPDTRSVAVMLAAGIEEELKATWMRRLFGGSLSRLEANALESDVISLSASAIRDGVTTSVRLPADGFIPLGHA